MPKDLAVVINDGRLNALVVTALAEQKYRLVMLWGEPKRKGDSDSRAHGAYEQQVAHFRPHKEHHVPTSSPVTLGITRSQQAADPRGDFNIGIHLLQRMPLYATAAQLAAYYQATAIYIPERVGNNADELAAATEFFQIYSEMLQHPCGLTQTEVIAPILELEPWQVVDIGFQLGVPFERAWSCQADGELPCLACNECRAREQAFTQAGKADPLKPS